MRAIPATVRPVLFDGGLFLRYNKTNKERRVLYETIITIGRQFGSGGKEIGIRVAKELGIPFYDKELLQEAAKKSGLCEKIFENFRRAAQEPPVLHRHGFLYVCPARQRCG